MPRLDLILEDQLMNKLSAMALKRRVTSEALGLEALKRFVSSDSDSVDVEEPGSSVYDRYSAAALKRVQALKPGTKFSLNGNYKDAIRLFTRDEWAAMRSQDGFAPHVFGKHFYQCALEHADLIELSDKGPDNKQRYLKV